MIKRCRDWSTWQKQGIDLGWAWRVVVWSVQSSVCVLHSASAGEAEATSTPASVTSAGEAEATSTPASVTANRTKDAITTYSDSKRSTVTKHIKNYSQNDDRSWRFASWWWRHHACQSTAVLGHSSRVVALCAFSPDHYKQATLSTVSVKQR